MKEFEITIPTYNRPKDLAFCFGSIAVQTRRPTSVIVVDDGDLGEKFVDEWRQRLAEKGIDLTYRRKNHAVEPRGSSASRNLALDLVSKDVFFILDDDTILEPEFCERIMEVWEERDDELIGVGGIISNHRWRSAWERAYHRFFGLSSSLSWDVNEVGYQVWDEDITDRVVGHYAHGGVCSYNLEKTRALMFSTFTGGRTALEDVDFAARAKQRGWHFIIEPHATLGHYPKPAGREGEAVSGRKESENRRAIFRKLNPAPSIRRRLWFAWASLGWVLRQALTGHLSKAWGMVVGFTTIVA
jgi:glycosyltransferase involved in cell wall biosynthesis